MLASFPRMFSPDAHGQKILVVIIVVSVVILAEILKSLKRVGVIRIDSKTYVGCELSGRCWCTEIQPESLRHMLQFLRPHWCSTPHANKCSCFAHQGKVILVGHVIPELNYQLLAIFYLSHAPPRLLKPLGNLLSLGRIRRDCQVGSPGLKCIHKV